MVPPEFQSQVATSFLTVPFTLMAFITSFFSQKLVRQANALNGTFIPFTLQLLPSFLPSVFATHCISMFFAYGIPAASQSLA
jgi:hypothetical protein